MPGNPAIKFNEILSGINFYSENTIYKKVYWIPGNPHRLLCSGQNMWGSVKDSRFQINGVVSGS
jgi:hypothetical protein